MAFWLVRTKVLREEIIHDLLHGLLDASEIVWLGAPAARLATDGRSESEDTRFQARVRAHCQEALQEIERLKAMLT